METTKLGAAEAAPEPCRQSARRIPDTCRPFEPTCLTGLEEDVAMLKKAQNKATEIAAASLELYREMALSALRLVPGRR